MLKRPMLLGAALAVLLSTPASAQVTLAELAPCYVSAQNDSQLVDVAAGGFTPFSKLDIFVNEVRVDTADADLNGNAFGRVKAPVVTSGQQVFKVRVAEEGRPENTIAKYSIVTAFSVQQSPKVARTSQRVTFRGRGFT